MRMMLSCRTGPTLRVNLDPKGGSNVSTFLWFLFGVVYLTALIVLGVSTLRKGHYFLFVVGIVFPVLWIVGALLGPTPRAAAAAP